MEHIPYYPDLAPNGFRILNTHKKIDDGSWSYSTTGLPKMFPTVALSLGQVHSCSRRVFRRWPLSIRCKYIDTVTIKIYQELHSHTSYLLSYNRMWLLYSTSVSFTVTLKCKYIFLKLLSMWMHMSETMCVCRRFDVVTAVKFRLRSFSGLTPCSVAVGHRRFRGPGCRHLQGIVFIATSSVCSLYDLKLLRIRTAKPVCRIQ